MIKFFSKIIDFYIHGSIHVALSVFALVHMTFHFFAIPLDAPMAFFAFFGTIVGYNFVKYDALIRTKRLKMTPQRIAIVVLSSISLLATTYCFVQLRIHTQIIAVACLVVTMWYTLPFFPRFGNARNWAGIKIYIVAFCWVVVTLILPIINANLPITYEVGLKFAQRFLLIIVLILIFEIIDLQSDATSLQTVPQKIGVFQTKLLNFTLLPVFYILELFRKNVSETQLWINLVLVIIIGLFTWFATPHRSKYYTAFWVEAIPIFWWILVLSLK